MENQTTLLIFMFGFGIFLQAANLLKPPVNFSKILMCLFGAALFGFSPFKHEKGYNPQMHLLAFFIAFVCVFAVFFIKEILPVINEKVLLIFTIIFWYVFSIHYGYDHILEHPFTLLALFPTALILWNAFTNFKTPFSIKLFLYIWFLVMVSSFSYVFFFEGILRQIFILNQPLHMNAFESFMYGGSFLYLMSNLVYLFYLIPIPGKHQSFRDRIMQWKQFVHLLVHKYDNAELHFWQSVFLILFFGSIFITNFIYQFINPMLLVSISFLLVSLMAKIEEFLFVK